MQDQMVCKLIFNTCVSLVKLYFTLNVNSLREILQIHVVIVSLMTQSTYIN